ncbi:hypothetical protein C4K22_0196 [Pseudomonas chlororaphis subsp. aurantiaca]|nr:hypothetical protein C4K22_0196 [Pseudomonas chlororaphis subsp. aurantiaca]AZD39301.1 hypothetical protein C4K21_0195 [Pseudomonas chlororaphis subsp. aurantiaca]
MQRLGLSRQLKLIEGLREPFVELKLKQQLFAQPPINPLLP